MDDVVVVGGDGFIGRHLLGALAADGVGVHATFRPGAEPPPMDGVNWIPCDVTNGGSFDLLPSTCASVVFLVQSRRWREFPEGASDVFSVNIGGAFHAMEYARRAGVRRFVFTSSGSVYPPVDRPMMEDDVADVRLDRRFYDATKLAVELMVNAYHHVFAPVVLRLFVPYGPGQDPLMLIPDVVRRVRDGRPVVLDGADGLVANPVAVSDVGEAIARVLSLEGGVTLNVAGPECLTLRQMADAIASAVGTAARFEHRSTPSRSVIGDTSALHARLGWAPKRRFADGVRDMLPTKTVEGIDART